MTPGTPPAHLKLQLPLATVCDIPPPPFPIRFNILNNIPLRYPIAREA
jgi:hypothetical protein